MKNDPRAQGLKSWRGRLMWTANVVAIVALLLAYLGTEVDPRKFWPLAFISMAYPLLLLLNVAFIGYWSIYRKKRALWSLSVILLGWTHLNNFVQIRAHDAEEDGFKVMSYNVRLFDFYNWSHNKETRNRIFEMLGREDADILCLQEFIQIDRPNTFNTRDTIMETFAWKHCHDVYTQTSRTKYHFGIATMSKFPIVAKGSIDLSHENNNVCIWSDLLIGSDTVRLYNAHLGSIRFGNDDYRFMEELDDEKSTEPLTTGGVRILGRLRDAFKKRSDQIDQILAHMEGSPHPIIYCGDLNDTPISYSYDRLREKLKDAFVESGSGIGNTYIGAFPSFRIDHIMHTSELQSSGFSTLPDELSDHHAVTAVVKVR